MCHRLRVDNKSDAIDEARQNGISQCYAMIDAIERDYQRSAKQCTKNEHCDTMVLGGLVKALVAQELRPFLGSPFSGLSYLKVANDFGNLSIPTLCEIIAPKRGDRYSTQPAIECGVKKTISAELMSILRNLQGLELDQYCKKEQTTDD
jgi:hypothetical protein